MAAKVMLRTKRDVVALIQASNEGRLEELVAVRHGDMSRGQLETVLR